MSTHTSKSLIEKFKADSISGFGRNVTQKGMAPRPVKQLQSVQNFGTADLNVSRMLPTSIKKSFQKEEIVSRAESSEYQFLASLITPSTQNNSSFQHGHKTLVNVSAQPPPLSQVSEYELLR